jgi:hypothetical protein
LVNQDAQSEAKLRAAFRGRISYVRGMDPRSYPMRYDRGVQVFDDLPPHRVWPCYMQGQQLEAYLETFMREFRPNVEAGQRNDLWNKTREVARVLLKPGMGKWHKHRVDRWVGNVKHRNWRFDNVRDISVKFHEMHRICHELHPVSYGYGPVLIYSANVETGVKPGVTFFAANGAKEWNAGEKISEDDAAPRMVTISGTVSMGRAREAIKMLKSDANYDSSHIRYVHGSPKICTGVTFRHFSTAILTELGWTWAEMEQVFGRVCRHGSHEHCTVPGCNKTVNVYILCSMIRWSDVEALPNKQLVRNVKSWIKEHTLELAQRNFLKEDGSLYTVDERTLRVALERDKSISKMLRLMKEMQLPLNLAQNFFADEGETFSNTRLYEYQAEPATVPVPSEQFPSHPRLVHPVPLLIDDSFITLDGWFQHVCGANIDWRGNIRLAILEALERHCNWTITGLVDHVSQEACVSKREVELVLQGSYNDLELNLRLDTGWVFSGDDRLDPVDYWQQSRMADDESPYTPPSRLQGLSDLLRDHVDIDELLGTFSEEAPTISISSNISTNCVTLSAYDIVNEFMSRGGCVFNITPGAPFCGAYDNTSDNPDDYCLKIVTLTSSGDLSKIAAHSRHNVDGLVALVNEIDGDPSVVLNATHKKNAACDELARRLKETGRLLPFMPSTTAPTLYRLMCVASEWGMDDLPNMLSAVASTLTIHSTETGQSPLEKLCIDLIHHARGSTPEEEELPLALFQKLRQQICDRLRTIPHYVLRVLDRMCGKRPRTWTAKQFQIVKRWYHRYVIEACKLKLAIIYDAVRTEMLRRQLEPQSIVSRNKKNRQSKKRTRNSLKEKE